MVKGPTCKEGKTAFVGANRANGEDHRKQKMKDK
jgi:hypothetical protein